MAISPLDNLAAESQCGDAGSQSPSGKVSALHAGRAQTPAHDSRVPPTHPTPKESSQSDAF